ncbi:MAG: ATP-binding protein [Nanoarchaeota archaeon]|nr:ATP-binding protein [Nanoarchaeota archaeon]MBU4299664.1 ATP-binding protein [Nanoarchaeota archaeon]MBU4451473.1 ATP-binding protein [Nanoarchaeota archaeon]MCG2723393.1 ATP-binding protein [archaeon]
MKNIPFIDREKEMEVLERTRDKNFFMIVRGRRRIGKTTLLRKAFPDAIYIFIWPNKSHSWIVNQICIEYGLPQFQNFIDIVKYLLDKNKIIIIDEFQNFLNVDKSVFGEMQKLVDDRMMKKENTRIIVSGSSYSLIKKIFNLEAAPLYGRRTNEMILQELPAEKLLFKMSMEEFIKTWSIFGGVPYYYTLLDENIPVEKMITRMIEEKDSMLMDEGRAVLSVEFGGESKTYNTIITAIAEGKTRLNEISTLFSNKKGETIKYLDLLRKEFNLIKRETPILSDPRKSREGTYAINDNFLSFWFYFVDKQRAYMEQERFDEVTAFFKENFPKFVGKKFEKFIIYIIRNKIILADFGFIKLGRQWGRIHGADDGKNQYEIDIVALNGKQMLLGECKWQEDVDAKEILDGLWQKASYIDTENKSMHFAIFAKSFSSKPKSHNEMPVLCFDLHDIEKAIRKQMIK